jgi:hypothetical protein
LAATLNLGGLASLSYAAAESLGKHKGKLYLEGSSKTAVKKTTVKKQT